ncbi:U1 small nuclear ribonucleoprotein [Physcia stellaris]|nr:U1 small nuclear ribonucleoprotein [Physcia stellaris]
MAPPTILILGTCDTKLAELLYLRSRIEKHRPDTSLLLMDVSKSDATAYITEGAKECIRQLCDEGKVHGIVAIGGSSGTSLAAAAMRESAPFTMPKLIVSTVASGDTAPFVGENDITMMYSIVDIAGSNRILNSVLDNAAGAIVGMAAAYRDRLEEEKSTEGSGAEGKRVGITMFGVTTPCVDAMRRHLTEKYHCEVYVFHATGHGGRAMERLITSGELDAVIDLTTTEIADHIVGGVMSAGPHRLEAAAKAGIPQVISVGACDMVNFGPRSTVPEKFTKGDRNLYEHNPSVTLVRTDKEECKQIGEFIANRLRQYCRAPSLVQVVLPTGGVSMISKPGDPYDDREADEALYTAIEAGLKGSGIEVSRDKRDINNESFALNTAERLIPLLKLAEK